MSIFEKSLTTGAKWRQIKPKANFFSDKKLWHQSLKRLGDN